MGKVISNSMVGTPRSRIARILEHRLSFFVLNISAMCLVWALDRKFFDAAVNSLDKGVGVTGNDAFGIAFEGWHYWLVAEFPVVLVAVAFGFWRLGLLHRKNAGVEKIGWLSRIIIISLWVFILAFHSQTPMAVVVLFSWVHLPRF